MNNKKERKNFKEYNNKLEFKSKNIQNHYKQNKLQAEINKMNYFYKLK